MVLFYDDVKVTKAPRTGWRKYLYRFIKVSVILTLLTSAGLWGLSKAGGNSRALRLGIQDYLTDATGYIAQIDQLANMKFFPVTHVQFAGLKLHEPVRKDMTAEERAAYDARKKDENFMPQPPSITDYYDTGAINASVGAVDIQMNFWDMFFARRRFYVLNIKDIKAQPGIWSPRGFHVQSLRLDPLAQPPQIVAQGTYGAEKFNIEVQAAQQGRGLYQISNIAPYTLKLGAVTMAGTVHSAPGSTVKFDISDLTIGAHHFTGHVNLTAHHSYNQLEATLATGNSDLQASLKIDGQNISGTITARALDLDDLGVIDQAYRHLRDLWGAPVDERVHFGAYNADVKLVIEKLVTGKGDQSAGDLQAAMKIEPYKLQFENILGVVNGGALRGDFVIDATGTADARLNSAMSWRGWDIAGAGQKASAQLDSFLTLAATGKSWAALEKNLKGEFITLGGAGVIGAENARYWGKEALETLLPQQKPAQTLQLQCVIAAFTLQGPQARAQTFFADFAELLVTGEGSLNLPARTLNWNLTPQGVPNGMEGKAAPLHITGALQAPQITAGRLLSLSNRAAHNKPAIKADEKWPLAQWGVNSSHPCWAYIEQN